VIIVVIKTSMEYAKLCMSMRLGIARYSACASGFAVRPVQLIGCVGREELVHGFGSSGQNRPQFAPVDHFGRSGACVPCEPCDFLDWHS
jgi:hypothetical protein